MRVDRYRVVDIEPSFLDLVVPAGIGDSQESSGQIKVIDNAAVARVETTDQ